MNTLKIKLISFLSLLILTITSCSLFFNKSNFVYQEEEEESEIYYNVKYMNGRDKVWENKFKLGDIASIPERYTVGLTYRMEPGAYDFVGWNYSENLKGDYLEDIVVRSDLTLYAVYEKKKNTYDVKLFNDSNFLDTLYMTEGEKITIDTYSPKPTKEPTESMEYEFIGWNTMKQKNDVGQAREYTVNSSIASKIDGVTITLYAVFKELKDVYSVSFYNGSTLIDTKDLRKGFEITKDEPQINPTKPSNNKYEYTFIGWSIDSYEDNDDVGEPYDYVVDNDLTLFAVYSRKQIYYTVSYYNENTFLFSNDYYIGTIITNETYQANSSYDNTSYKIFKGWNENPDDAKKGIINNYEVNRDLVLYAAFTIFDVYSMIYNNSAIELNHKGIDDVNSGLHDSVVVIPDDSTYNYSFTFEDSQDNNYFSITEIINESNKAFVLIKALKPSRITNIIVKRSPINKDEFKEYKRIKLLSVSTNITDIVDYERSRIYNYNLDNLLKGKVGYGIRLGTISSDNEDLVIPSKVKKDGIIGPVYQLLSNNTSDLGNHRCRKAYYPSTIFEFDFYSLSCYLIKEYAYFQKSDLNFCVISGFYDESSYYFFADYGAPHSGNIDFPYKTAILSQTEDFSNTRNISFNFTTYKNATIQKKAEYRDNFRYYTLFTT